MWLITTIGFFSVVQKPGDTILTVRARVADDLDRLREQYMPTLSATRANEGTDYPYRATIDHAAFAQGLAQLTQAIDYSNFKDEVARALGHRRAHIYHKVWHSLFELQRGTEN